MGLELDMAIVLETIKVYFIVRPWWCGVVSCGVVWCGVVVPQ